MSLPMPFLCLNSVYYSPDLGTNMWWATQNCCPGDWDLRHGPRVQWWVVLEWIFNVTQEELVISGSDSFSRACAPSYRFCTGKFTCFESSGFSESFVHHVTMQYEPERELISSPFESLCWSRSFITWQPHMLNLCSLTEEDLIIIIIIITNSLVDYLCHHIYCYGKEPSWQKFTQL